MRRLATLALLVAACQAGPAAPDPTRALAPEALGPGGRPVAGATLRVAADDPRLLDGPGQARVPLATTRTLLGRLIVPQLAPGVHWAHFELYTPTGALYQERHLPYALGRAPRTVPSPDGVPHPIDVERAEVTAEGVALDLSIVVGGSNLQRRPQPGVWRLHGGLDRTAGTADDASFELTLAP
jgi:hypothetical protein